MQAIYIGTDTFSVYGDKTDEFTVNRRVKLNCGVDGVFYASVVSSSINGSNTEITIDETVLTSNLTTVYYSVISPGTYGGFPDHTHDSNEGEGGNLYNNIEELIFFLGG